MVLAPRTSGVGVRPPGVKGITGERDHRVEEDEQVDGAPRTYDRRSEDAHRFGDHDGVAAIAQGVYDRIANGKSGAMPGFKKLLSEAEIQALTEYIKTLPAN